MKLFIGDYERGTGHLTLVQHGALFALLRAYYAREAALPSDLESLYRIARATTKTEQAAVRDVVAEFFKPGDDGVLHNARADRQIAADLTRIERGLDNGRKGGRPRKQTGEGNPNANLNGNLAANSDGNPDRNPTRNPNGNLGKTQLETSPAPAPAPAKEKDPKPLRRGDCIGTPLALGDGGDGAFPRVLP